MALSNYATNFAIIENGIVKNTIWGNIYNASDFPNAVQIDDLAVQAGDAYDGEHFYRDGERVKTVAEQIADMEKALASLEVAVDE